MLVFLVKTLKRRIETVYRLLFRYTSWNVGIVHAPISAFLTSSFKPTIRWLPQSRKGHIQADPFGRSDGHRVTSYSKDLIIFNRKE